MEAQTGLDLHSLTDQVTYQSIRFVFLHPANLLLITMAGPLLAYYLIIILRLELRSAVARSCR